MADDIFQMQGKVALVTGASSGFGVHFAKILAEHGAKVVVGARRLEKLESLAAEISSAGGDALAVKLDVTNSTEVTAAFDAAEQAFGLVDVVSNNAGIAEIRLAVKTDEASWDRVFDTNLKGVWNVAWEAGRRLIAAGKPGSIVNTASVGGLRVIPGYSSYGTSKAAVIQLTKNLALEWARKGIRVNALCPGFFITELNQDYLTSDAGKAFVASTTSQRVGEMSDITAPFLLLASDAGTFLNGVVLPVDGATSLGNITVPTSTA